LLLAMPETINYQRLKIVCREHGRENRCRSGSADVCNWAGDGGRPSGAVLQEMARNHRILRRSRAGVGSDAEKTRRERVRCGPRRRAWANHCWSVESSRWHQNRGL